MISSPGGPVCQMNVEVCQDRINAKYGTRFSTPVSCYATLMSVAYGRDAGLGGRIIPARKLEKIAGQ